MCPESSPAKGAPISRIFALMTECPDFQKRTRPPRRSISSGSAMLHLGSTMASVPGRAFRISAQ